MTALPSPEQDLLAGLQTLLTPLATGPGTLFQLSPTPDVQWALGFTRGPTDVCGRWGQGVLMLLTRGDPGDPLTVHGYADPVLRRLIALVAWPLGSVSVNTVEHRGHSTGVDSKRRTIRADTLFVDLDYQA